MTEKPWPHYEKYVHMPDIYSAKLTIAEKIAKAVDEIMREYGEYDEANETPKAEAPLCFDCTNRALDVAIEMLNRDNHRREQKFRYRQ